MNNVQPPVVSPIQDPLERWAPLALKLTLYGFLTYYFYQASITFVEYRPLQHWPTLLSTFRMFTFLPIHEAGHLFFSFFGRTTMILGGSIMQVLLMLIWFLIALRERSHVAPFPLYWVGINLMDVSLYVRDAQFRALPLLGGDSSGHDWYNLLTQWNALDSAGTIADVLYLSGVAVAGGAIATGIFLAFTRFVHVVIPPVPLPKGVPPIAHVEDILDRSFEQREKKFRSETKRPPAL
jgi:hypothetical protein